MKLMDKEKFMKELQELCTEVKKTDTSYNVSMKVDDSREEKCGSLTFVFSIKKKAPKSKEYKISMYIFESCRTISTFIINGRTLGLLFENSTMNSPEVALHYLKDILIGEIKWILNIEDMQMKKKAEMTEKKKNNTSSNYKGKHGDVKFNKHGIRISTYPKKTGNVKHHSKNTRGGRK